MPLYTFAELIFYDNLCNMQLSEQISDLPTEYQNIVIKVLTTRRDDVRCSVVDSLNDISHASLVDFDWNAKVFND